MANMEMMIATLEDAYTQSSKLHQNPKPTRSVYG
jgi:hypothetical protein